MVLRQSKLIRFFPPDVTLGRFRDARKDSGSIGFSIEGTCESQFAELTYGYAYLDRCYNFDVKNAKLVPTDDGKGNFYAHCGECRLTSWPQDMIMSCSCYLRQADPPHWDIISVNLGGLIVFSWLLEAGMISR